MSKILAIGIGNIGQQIVSNLHQYGVYELHSVLSPQDKQVNNVNPHVIDLKSMKGKLEHELYDDWFENNDLDLPKKYDECVIFVSGKSDISGATLRIANKYKDNLTIVYTHPDRTFLSEYEKMQEKVTFYVLQEYARSGLLKDLLLFDMKSIEAFMGNLSIKNYFNQINKFIADQFHSWMWCNNNEPILSVSPNFTPHAKIGTLGVIGNNGENIVFFPLKNHEDGVPYQTDVRYYYMIGDTKLEEDKNLLTTIKDDIVSKTKKFNTVGYGIYEVEDDAEATLIFTTTSKIQKLGENDES
jgi:hypothetical protein